MGIITGGLICNKNSMAELKKIKENDQLFADVKKPVILRSSAG